MSNHKAEVKIIEVPMERTATAAQIEEHFIITGDMTEAKQGIRDVQDKEWDQEKAADLIEAIFQQLEEQAASEGKSLETWGVLDRITWVVKEAYIIGFLQGFETTMEANKAGYNALFENG